MTDIPTLAEAEAYQVAHKQAVTTRTVSTGTNTDNDTVSLVNNYIAENVLQSKLWDEATEAVRIKAVNNAKRVLKTVLNTQYKSEPPIEHLAEQAVWLLKMDDSFQRMQLGASSISVDGVTISFREKDNSIAPFVLQALCLPCVTRRRVGSYTSYVGDTQRRIR